MVKCEMNTKSKVSLEMKVSSDFLLTIKKGNKKFQSEEDFFKKNSFVYYVDEIKYCALRDILSYFSKRLKDFNTLFYNEIDLENQFINEIENSLYYIYQSNPCCSNYYEYHTYLIYYGNLILKHLGVFGKYVINFSAGTGIDDIDYSPILLLSINQYKELLKCYFNDIQFSLDNVMEDNYGEDKTSYYYIYLVQVQLLLDLRDSNIISEKDFQNWEDEEPVFLDVFLEKFKTFKLNETLDEVFTINFE